LRAKKLKDDTGTIGLGFYTRRHPTPDLLKKQFPLTGETVPMCGVISIHHMQAKDSHRLRQSSSREIAMSKFALYVPLEAKPGKEKEVSDFLKSALPLVEDEPGTVTWFAIQEGPSSFAIFDTFDDEAGRDAHLNGKVAAALMAKAGELLAKPPAIHKITILADKLP
jgi:quinol monooxygenase YgiN